MANKTPNAPLSPETYLGFSNIAYNVGSPVTDNKEALYHGLSTIPTDSFAFMGWWTDHAEEATAGDHAGIGLDFTANDVYLVMGGSGTVSVSLDNRELGTLHVAGIPKLYTLLSGRALQSGLLQLTFSPGVQAYDFTFG